MWLPPLPVAQTLIPLRVAQLTRGEGNWATLGLYASMEGRILSACDALLGCAPFWFRVRPASRLPCTCVILEH